MIEICISILCAIIIFLTWSIEALKRKISRLETDLFIAQVEIHNLKEQKDEQMYKENFNN